MVNLYVTQDRIGTPTGGGAVTYHEYTALAELGEETHPVDSGRVAVGPDPFVNDGAFAGALKGAKDVKLAAFYAGCFTETVSELRTTSKISYTAAAHDIKESRREFEDLGIPFNFPHLTVPELWKRYVWGYVMSDLVICPSTLSKRCMESYGCEGVIVIPHGCEIPATVAPLPKKFTVGYLGQAGPDKGLRYLFEAWKKLDLKDATLLIAGNNIEQALPLWRKFGGGNVEFTGFVKNVSDFYSKISLYIQPSVTEGFGIEVLEAQAHGRQVLCSNGAGGQDVVSQDLIFEARNVDQMMSLISHFYKDQFKLDVANTVQKRAANYTWDKIRARYQAAWRNLLA